MWTVEFSLPGYDASYNIEYTWARCDIRSSILVYYWSGSTNDLVSKISEISIQIADILRIGLFMDCGLLNAILQGLIWPAMYMVYKKNEPKLTEN